MKKCVVLVMILAVLSLCSCGENLPATENNINDTSVESIKDKLVADIEGEYQKETEKAEYMTTLGMIELANKYGDKWKAVSDEYYNKILSAFTGPEADGLKEKLDALKVSYEEYAKDNLAVHTEIYKSQYTGGSIIGPLCASKQYELQKEYALTLIGIYEQFVSDV